MLDLQKVYADRLEIQDLERKKEFEEIIKHQQSDLLKTFEDVKNDIKTLKDVLTEQNIKNYAFEMVKVDNNRFTVTFFDQESECMYKLINPAQHYDHFLKKVENIQDGRLDQELNDQLVLFAQKYFNEIQNQYKKVFGYYLNLSYLEFKDPHTYWDADLKQKIVIDFYSDPFWEIKNEN